MLTPKSFQAHHSSPQQSNIAHWWRGTTLQDKLGRRVLAACLKLLKSFAFCKNIGMVNMSLQTSTKTMAEAPKMSTRSWARSILLTRLLDAMTAPSSRVPSGLWPITKSQRTPSGLYLPSILVLLRAQRLQLADTLKMSTKGAILGASLRTTMLLLGY